MDICVTLPGWIDEITTPGAVFATDEDKMEIAVALAAENVRRGGGPFGAVICNRATGRLVAGGCNLVVPSGLSLFHAEVTAIAAAQRRVGGYSLNVDGGHEIFTSSEPCAMCLGAIFWSGARRIVYGASCDAARAIGFDEGPVFPETWAYLRNAGIEVTGGVLAAKSQAVLTAYKEGGGEIYNP
ncbi:nucleoside deaminase [Fundidesulfovibrio terrae]|uniref:nucleoside deaminase n=1 Tax=Fundidesulfovibrio terrae TaxID=2922866 RepID=UPI001FAEC67F|nr:nucleoside deaminase [Fundidesulfovibrio terrae]